MTPRIFILLTCVCLIGSNGLILSPVLSAIALDFDTSVTTVSRSIAGYGVGTAVSAFFLGRYIEQLGYLRVLVVALIVAGSSQLVSAQVQAWGPLTVAQVFAGVATGVALPSIYALTAEVSQKGKEAKTLGIVVFGWSLALIAAIPVGTFVAHHLGWRMMLTGLGALLLLTILFLEGFRGVALPKATRKASGVFTPLTYSGAIAIYAICGLFMAGFYGTYAFTGAHAVDGFNLTIAHAGYVGLAYGAGFGIGSANAGQIDRVGRDRALSICLFAGGVALALTAFAAGYLMFLILFVVIGVANSLVVNMIVMRVGALNAATKGASLGLYTTISYVGVTFGTLTYGKLYELYGFGLVAITAAGSYAVAGVLAKIKPGPPASYLSGIR